MSGPDAQPAAAAPAYAAALRTRRKSLGISMVSAAEAAGMSRASWHRLEKGEPGVAVGLLLAAAEVLGLDLEFVTPAEAKRAEPASVNLDDQLPLRIRLDAYPQLRRLAWQVHDGSQVLAPHEALALYERNWRHLDRDALEPRERALIRALGTTFGVGHLDV